ncbi:FadR/GntR family transcriptional regulator [Pseudonocardia halophobica]|uniref:FadR/GntR family transcriptional regulator n=1 Tax=Pseudonocardia halophobica TaxID=29401 RepID=UPI003D945198
MTAEPPADVPRSARRRPDLRRPQKVPLMIAQRIVDDITGDGLGPGTRLAGEREMMARFSAGRGTLREALRFLELTGVITVKAGPRGGPVVMQPDGTDLAGVLGLFLQLRTVSFRSVIQVREILEPELAALAANGTDAAAAAEIADSITGMRAFLDDEENFLAENDRFHLAVAAAAGNELFELLISSLHLITDGMPLGVSYPPRRRAAVLGAHEAIHAALLARDPDRAREAMRRHMAEFRRYVETRFPGVYERPVRWRDIAP